MVPHSVTAIPFSFFVSLCEELSKIEPRSIYSAVQPVHHARSKSAEVFRRWVHELHRRFPQLPPGTATILFLFLFPEEDSCRKYGMQEPTLAKALIDILDTQGEGRGGAKHLTDWALPSTDTSSLGEAVMNVMSNHVSENNDHARLSINDVNSILDELASKSHFSEVKMRSSVTTPSRTRRSILQSVYCKLRPFEAAVLTQIILKDLRPILYPTNNVPTTESLLNYKATSVHELALHEAMRVWDPPGVLLRCYRVQSTIEHSFTLFEERKLSLVGPRIGVPVEIPKCVKAQGCSDALTKFKTGTSIWAETKYDGERMQIHVEAREPGHCEITIFSKSKRNSTMDRIATHWIIKESLGLSSKRAEEVYDRALPRTTQNETVCSVILEAEMVAYNKDIGIDEFWRIRELVESTADGPRRKRAYKSNQQQERTFEPTLHLALVFFDILFWNGRSLLSEPYCVRRATLESVVTPIPMYAFLAKRVEIPLSHRKNPKRSLEELERMFLSCITNREEGLVLKASHATYADWRDPWVKLKKDYIPGYGDAVDLVIVAATWEKERGRTLRVSTATYTTFYVGVFDKTNLPSSRPHLEVFFTVSYGLDRQQLEELNYLIKSTDPLDCRAAMQSDRLPFTFNLARDLPEPSVILTAPLLIELYGAGFTKSGEMKHYELRFPRISKVYRRSDRNWLEGLDLLEFNDIAHNATRKDSSGTGTSNNRTGPPQNEQTHVPGSSRTTKREPLWDFAEERSERLYECCNIVGCCGLPGPRSHYKRQKMDDRYLRAGLVSAQIKSSCPSAIGNMGIETIRSPLKSLTNRATYVCVGGFPSFDPNVSMVVSHECLGTKQTCIATAHENNVHPFANFLRKAIIFSESHFASSNYYRPFIDRFVMPNLVHSFEAFALGCGYNQFTMTRYISDAARYGVIFTDRQTSRDWLSKFPSSGRLIGTGRLPVFLFSMDCLRTDDLDDRWHETEMDIKARCLAIFI